MDAPRPNLRLVETSPWNRPEAYRPDPIEMLRERRPSFGERLVSFMRKHGETIGFVFAMCAIVFAVGVFVFAYARVL